MKGSMCSGYILTDSRMVDNPNNPWDCDIYLHEWWMFIVNVAKYTIFMDPMAKEYGLAWIGKSYQ